VAPADPAGPAATDPGPAGAIAPEPAARAEASAAPKPEPEPVAKPDPVARPEPKTEPKPEPKTEPKPAPKAEPKPAPKAEPKQASKTEAKPAARPEAKPVPADASPGGFVVQLGAFSDPGNARTLLGRLKQAQIPAYAEAVKTSNGTRTRVRAGPYSSEAAAEKGRDRVLALKIATGDLKVVRQGD
jgi:DedD protein